MAKGRMGRLFRKQYGSSRPKQSMKARKFISEAIKERQDKYPEEPLKQSVAIAFSKARKKGYKV